MLGVSRVAMATALLVLSLVDAFETIEKNEVPLHNKYPCMPSPGSSTFKTFLKHHLLPQQPKSCDHNQWQTFIKKHRLCRRLTQSFLRHEDKQQVLNVCSKDGGKILSGNLCISGREFTFFTIRVDNNCRVWSVTFETEHIILACDKIKGACQPVHFEGNPGNKTPDKKMTPCQEPRNII